MKQRMVLLSLLMGLVGCVQSVQPFYKEDQLVFDPALSGTWQGSEDKQKFVVAGVADEKRYNLTYTDKDSKVGHFIVHLAKVEGQTLADVMPDEITGEQSDTYKGSLLPLHTVLLVEQSAPTLKLRPIDPDWLKKLLGEHPDALAHVDVGSDRIVLTASTEALQAFILKHLKTPGALGEETELKRMEASP